MSPHSKPTPSEGNDPRCTIESDGFHRRLHQYFEHGILALNICSCADA